MKNVFLDKFKTSKKEFRYIITFCLIVIIIHSFISRYHFHETDSSLVFYSFKLNSNDLFWRLKGHIEKTSLFVFYPIRFFLGIASDYIPIQPIRSALQLSLTTTYAPLQGFLYGFYIPDTYEYFYRYSALINIIFLLLSLFLLYLANNKYGNSKYISFIFSFGLLGLYQVNSYSFHLGSTIWNICSSCVIIYSITILKGRKRDIGFLVATLASYPTLLFFLVTISYEFFVRYKEINKFKKINKTKNFFRISRVIFEDYKFSTISFFLTILLFYPFGESFRGKFDVRGLFTPFALVPQYESINNITYIIFIFFALNCIFTIIILYKRLSKNRKDISTNLESSVIKIYFFILLLSLMISFGFLQLNTLRHLLFIIPYIFFLSNISFQSLINKLFSNLKFLLSVYKPLISLLLFSLFTTSLYSAYFRMDPLKVYKVPKEIIAFQLNQTNNSSITEMTGGKHYLYNDFSRLKASYDKKVPYRNLPLDFPGKRLIVTQVAKDIFSNYDPKLKKGDELKSNYQDIKITLKENPLIIENNTFFDSMNYHNTYEMRSSNSYSRPNNIYIFPVEIRKIR
tara:strand:+ start:311 stop:2020 length:1710 start_codon:yes stop_codon:yes gene_type:complete